MISTDLLLYKYAANRVILNSLLKGVYGKIGSKLTSEGRVIFTRNFNRAIPEITNTLNRTGFGLGLKTNAGILTKSPVWEEHIMPIIKNTIPREPIYRI